LPPPPRMVYAPEDPETPPDDGTPVLPSDRLPSHTPSSSETQWIFYETQSGDTLSALAVRFGVRVEEIQGPEDLPTEGFLPPGTQLRIPARPVPSTSDERLFPDSELVNSPSAVGFDIRDFVEQAGGYLAEYTQYLPSPGRMSGYEVVRFVALNYSINPRLLLALLEFQAQWVFGTPPTEEARRYPMGTRETPAEDLYRQLRWAAEQLAEGYYGWREGRLTQLTPREPRRFPGLLRIPVRRPLVPGPAGGASVSSGFAAAPYDSALRPGRGVVPDLGSPRRVWGAGCLGRTGLRPAGRAGLLHLSGLGAGPGPWQGGALGAGRGGAGPGRRRSRGDGMGPLLPARRDPGPRPGGHPGGTGGSHRASFL